MKKDKDVTYKQFIAHMDKGNKVYMKNRDHGKRFGFGGRVKKKSGF